MIEFKVKKAPAPTALTETLEERIRAAYERGGRGEGETISGAAAGAGVLTAVDEDEEGAEEADVPGEFEYFTDNEEEQ